MKEVFDNNTEMKKYKTIIWVLVVCIIGLVIAFLTTYFSRRTREIVFDESNLSLIVGQSYYVHASVVPSNARNSEYELVSSDTRVVEIHDGVIEARGEGFAVVKAVQKGTTYGQCNVTVRHVQPLSMSFAYAFEGKIGRPEPLEVSFDPEDTTDTDVEYSISDSDKAHIVDGKLVYEKPGTIELTARHKKTGLECSTEIDISPVAFEEIRIKDPGEIHIGETIRCEVTLLPEDVTEQEVTWKNFDNEYATFKDGTLTAKKEGKVTIKAVQKATGTTAKCEIVIKRIKLQSLTLNLKDGDTIYVGDKIALTATPVPSNTSEVKITWKSANTAVVEISKKTLIAKKAGTVKITATDKVSGKTKSVTVTVSAVKAQSVSLSRTSATIKVGETLSLSTTITPKNVTSRKITWSSSNKKVATVSEKGVVTAKGAGTATITAKTNNGKTATCTITVKPKPVTIKNGFVVKPSGRRIAPVKIHAPSNESVYVYFECRSNTSKSFSVLVKAGSTYSVKAPTGTYDLYYASGQTWYGKKYKFGDNTQFFKTSNSFRFYTSGNYVYGTEVTLYKVVNGNMSTAQIPASAFPD